ncbi:MASE1 domain-containing protein [Actinophytocola sp.]|uniref:MASE1 domain-containing protein n=1 Tax=Actinophytocola sp. TaxID=1872138 RepID=UPI003899BB97
MAQSRLPRRFLDDGVRILAVAGAYYIAAKIGLSFAVVGGQVTPLWPATGTALAGLLLFGRRCWPGIALAAFVVNAAIGPTLPVVIAISTGNTLAPVLAHLLLTRAGFQTELRRLRDVLALIFLGAFAGMLVSASVGAGALAVAGTQDFWVTWSVWWTGDAMGVLVVAPVLLVVATARVDRRIPLTRWFEAAVLFGGLTLVTIVVMQAPARLLFLIFPMLIWAALRFRQAGAAPGNLIVSIAAVLAAAAKQGPFAGMDLLPTMITLQAFNAAATLTALLLAAATSERDEAQRALQRAVSQISEAVAALEPYSLLRTGLLQRVLHERDAPAPDNKLT